MVLASNVEHISRWHADLTASHLQPCTIRQAVSHDRLYRLCHTTSLPSLSCCKQPLLPLHPAGACAQRQRKGIALASILSLCSPDPETGHNVGGLALRLWVNLQPVDTPTARGPRRLASPALGSPPWKDNAPRWRDVDRLRPGALPAWRGREWWSRAETGSAQARRYRMTHVPTGIRCQGHSDIRQTNASQLVAVIINGGNQVGIEFANLGGQERRLPFLHS
jgi:hypothetical protein